MNMQCDIHLTETTKQVFDECSPIYLREDKHWGCDLDIICEYVERFAKPTVIELGTGYAWHLANLFFIVSTSLNHVVGLDYSRRMLNHAHSFLSSNMHDNQPMIEKVELVQADMLELPLKEACFDVAIVLNNTLGNIPGDKSNDSKDQRRKAVAGIEKILRNTGYIIVSVYNADRLSEEDKYGDVFELDIQLSRLDTFDLVIRFKETGTPYYSHWFSKSEIGLLLYNAGFRIIEVEERKKRIIVVAQKRS